MRDLSVSLLRVGRSRLLFTLALAVPFAGGAPAPASAQDFFGLFRMLFQQPARAPAPYYHYPTAPQPRIRRPKVVRDEAAKAPRTPRPMGAMTNPVPELLADSTLRRGDMVMFPDGLRVFVGQTRGQHALEDFEPVSPNAKSVPQATRKLLAQLRPGWNGAWAADAPAAAGRIAAAKDVDSTGSIARRRR
jgi:hypothetical protein